MLQEDAPFYIIKMLNHGALLCEHSRYSVFIFQWIPFVAMKLGFSVHTIILVYSLSIELFIFSLFLFAYFILKSEKGALLLLLFLCYSWGRDFFLPVNEYALAVMSALPFYGLTFKNSFKENRLKLISGFLLLLVCINFHPIAVPALGFVFICGFLLAKREERKYWLLPSAVYFSDPGQLDGYFTGYTESI